MVLASAGRSVGRGHHPQALRDRLGITTGVVLDFHEEKGRIVAERVEADDPVAAVYGLFRDGRSTDALMRELRGEADE